MKLIKYTISRIKHPNDRIGKYNMKDVFDFKTVGVFGYFKHKKKGWRLDYTEYFLISKFYHFWKGLGVSNKIAIIISIIGIVIFLLDKLYFK